VSSVAETIAALRAGEAVLLPTDTVYGLCAAEAEGARERLAELKGRDAGQPIALVFADLESALERVPEAGRARGLLPGPFTIVAGGVGLRVPELPAEAREVVAAVGAVLATSANRHGGADPRTLEEVSAEIRAACGAELDGGELPGVPSTVIDLTGPEPRILREGAATAGEALTRLRG
jgi:L-threonylcarbamoyladenylate synthase